MYANIGFFLVMCSDIYEINYQQNSNKCKFNFLLLGSINVQQKNIKIINNKKSHLENGERDAHLNNNLQANNE